MQKLGFIFFFILIICRGTAQDRPATERQAIKEKIAHEKNDSVKVDLLNDLGFAYVFIYADSATVTAHQALNLSRSSTYKKGEIKSLGMLSLSLTILGNFTTALKYSFEALALAEKMGDHNLIAEALGNLMVCYRDQEDYKEALKYGLRGLELSQMSGVEQFQEFLLMGFVSSVYERDNQLDSALYFGLKASDINTFPWSGLYLTLGNVYSKRNENEIASLYYRKGISIAEDSRIYIDLVDIYNNLSVIKENAGNKDSSLYYAKKSMQTEGIHNYPEGELRTALQLAHLYESGHEKDSTIKYYQLSSNLRSSLLDRQKTREAQSLAFNDQLSQQQLAAREKTNRNKIRMYTLTSIIFLSFLAGFFLWRNNRHKQKANSILRQKNEEIQTALITLKNTQAQLIQSEKMASLGELTAGIAHEIQNPLNFVNNFSEVNKELLAEMKDEMKKGNLSEANSIADDIIGNHEKINHHGRRADAIVKGMLQHTRSSSGQKELTDINALCDEYLRLSYHGLRAKDKDFNATMKTDFDEMIGKINIIPQDIGRVLLNLYNNAFYACTEQSRSTASLPSPENIGTGNGGFSNSDKSNDPTIWLSTKNVGDKVLITVKDNGPGIPHKILDKIFQPFFTTKPTGKGTGLGLSLAYDIVKAHGGDIRVRSVEGEGSEFIVELKG